MSNADISIYSPPLLFPQSILSARLSPVVRIGAPRPITLKRVLPPPPWFQEGGTHMRAVGGGANSVKGTDTVVLQI
jgi:hypothetical protein